MPAHRRWQDFARQGTKIRGADIEKLEVQSDVVGQGVFAASDRNRAQEEVALVDHPAPIARAASSAPRGVPPWGMDSMWTCPRCSRRFANVNQWHSCGNPELAELLAPHTPNVVAIYRAVESAIATSGEFRVHPQKTRIAFISRMSFAGVKLARRWADLTFILPRPVDDDRIRRIDLYGPTSFGHGMRLGTAAEVDATVQRWLAEARRRGDQETLDPAAHIEPLVGRPLQQVIVPLAARIETDDDDLAIALPRYVGEGFAAHPYVVARISGTHYPGVVSPAPTGTILTLQPGTLQSLGLGDGDRLDVFLSADL